VSQLRNRRKNDSRKANEYDGVQYRALLLSVSQRQAVLMADLSRLLAEDTYIESVLEHMERQEAMMLQVLKRLDEK